ncbi:MAG TPA: serine hydrolase domain-containing protein [Steroidobacteraceae bacterium]|nr:serine hydrolase domain-containing protein [Steroidobacteraceae bacterium]
MKLRSPAMRNASVLALLILGALPCWSAAAEPFPAAKPESQGLSSQSLGELLGVVRRFAEKGEIVGGELLVIKNRRTVLHETVGLADLEKNQPLKRDTIYCIRSMTKPLTGAAVQILIDEGRLSLDDTAARYLPSFDNDKSRAITVRQLLTHTGGLPLSTLMSTNYQELSGLREVVDISGRNGPVVPPGSGFQYSDDGADTLGAIVSVVTGQPVESFITKRILEPLGMHDTFPLVRAAGDKLDRFTPSYAGSRGSWMRLWSPEDKPLFPYFLAAQSMYSTTRDYARFLALYLDNGYAGGKRVLSEAAIRRTLEPAIATGFPTGFPGLATHYGQMMLSYADTNKKLVAFGHGGSDGTWAYAWPEKDLMVFFYTQSRGNTTGQDFEAAIDRLLLGGAGAAPVVQDLTTEAAAPYLGVYWFEPQQRPMFVVLDKDRLALEIPWQGLVEMKRTDERDVWSPLAAPDISMKFHRAGDGPATALDLRQGQPVTLKRFQPEEGLPTLDELFRRRSDQQRAEKLGALGTLRMSGSVQITAGPQKGTFELLHAGNDHSRLLLKVNGSVSQQIVAGNRGWVRYQASMPAQEMSESMAQSTRLAGWMLSSGDWRGEFRQARVLKRVELDGKPVVLVHAAPEKGRQRLIYLDPESGLTLGFDEVYELPGIGMVGSEVRFSDYRDVEGVQIPFRCAVKWPTPMIGTQTYHVEKMETRVKLEKDPFTIE